MAALAVADLSVAGGVSGQPVELITADDSCDPEEAVAAEIAELQAADIDVLFIGGYHTEIALMARAAGDRGYPVQLVAGLGLTTEDFGLIGGPAAEGTLFIDVADPRGVAVPQEAVGGGRGRGSSRSSSRSTAAPPAGTAVPGSASRSAAIWRV